ncbi:hypothetical protein GCM10009575_069560 [Streptomyces rhizosphaericus]|uniref:Transposase n=1 Tax=Streptomyces rhizosphaericus TaxID=114699 RepID=A0ABN1QW96_9ACTN
MAQMRPNTDSVWRVFNIRLVPMERRIIGRVMCQKRPRPPAPSTSAADRLGPHLAPPDRKDEPVGTGRSLASATEQERTIHGVARLRGI